VNSSPSPFNPSHGGVAVIIAAHNATKTIVRAVTSALLEPEVSEVVVIDDGSTDNTLNLASSVEDGRHRVKVIVQTDNRGPAATRNRAIRESWAPWISILDADDFFIPGRIKELLKYCNDADLIADNAWQVPEDDLGGERKILLKQTLTAPQSVSFREFVLSNITDPKRERGELGFIKPLMRRSFLNEHKIRYQEHMRLGEDYELYAHALACGAKLLLVPSPGYVSVVRKDSLSGKHTEDDLLNLRNCDLTLAKLPGLSGRERRALRKHYVSIDCRLQWRRLISAVKSVSPIDGLATFIKPLRVQFYLVDKLTRSVAFRAGRMIKWMVPHRKSG